MVCRERKECVCRVSLEELAGGGKCRESSEFAGGELGLDPRPQGQWEAGNAIPFQPVNPLHCRKGLPFPPQHSLLAGGV